MTTVEYATARRFEVNAVVISHTRIVNNEYLLILHAPQIAEAAQPGQFLEVLTGDNYSPLLRRPFSIFNADSKAGTISIVYLARGSFTSGLARLSAGSQLSTIGPLGRGYRWESSHPIRHILVAGGIGAPPLHFLAQAICGSRNEHPVVVINGARTEELLVGIKEFSDLNLEVRLVTDDGSAGRKGRVVDELHEMLTDELKPGAQVYACGPMAMLKAVAQITRTCRTPCQVSVETAMPCGIGICMGCTIGIAVDGDNGHNRLALACTEGPVFDASAVDWG